MTLETMQQEWFASEATEVARVLEVDPAQGLGGPDVQSRRDRHGSNRLAGGKKESGFRAFLRQYEDFMQIVLLAAAVINQIVTGSTGTTVVLAGLTLLNAVIGLHQEAKAEESVAALASMMKTIARVRRDGQVRGGRCGGTGSRGCGADGGRQCCARRRQDHRRRHPGDRRGGPHRREPPGGEGDRARAWHSGRARRPDLHGIHEHLGDTGPGGDDRHRDRDGNRDRPYRRPPRQHRVGENAPPEATGQPVQDHRHHRRDCAGDRGPPRAGPG